MGIWFFFKGEKEKGRILKGLLGVVIIEGEGLGFFFFWVVCVGLYKVTACLVSIWFCIFLKIIAWYLGRFK